MAYELHHLSWRIWGTHLHPASHRYPRARLVTPVFFFAYVMSFLTGLYFLMTGQQDSNIGSMILGMILLAPAVAKLLNGTWRTITAVTGRAG